MFNLPPNFLTSFVKSQYTTLPYPSADLTGKTIIVTGANVGLGLEAARHFVRLNASKVILGCRNLEKANAAVLDIESTTGRKGVLETWEVDLNSYKSIQAFCKRAEGLNRLDIVVENAGIAIPRYVEVEGMESTIQTNVIATFLMALLLLPTLRRNAKTHSIIPRLVIVASDAHFQANFPESKAADIFSALNDKSNQADKYNTSKLLEILLVRELASAMSSSNASHSDSSHQHEVILNCLTPGLCESELMRHASLSLAIAARIAKVLLARSTEVGSRTLFAAAVAGDESHGRYMADCKVSAPSKFVRSAEGIAAGKKVYDELLMILEGIQPGIKSKL